MLNIASPSELVKNIGFAHTAATVSKEPIVINSKVMIPLNNADAGERNAFVYESEIDQAPTAAAQAWTVNAAIYWDATAKVFTTVSTSNTLCGYALQPKASNTTVSPLIAFDTFA